MRRSGQGALAILGILGLLIPFFGALWFARLSEREDSLDHGLFEVAVLDWRLRMETLARDPQFLRDLAMQASTTPDMPWPGEKDRFLFKAGTGRFQYPMLHACDEALDCPVEGRLERDEGALSWTLTFRSRDLSRTGGPLPSKLASFQIQGNARLLPLKSQHLKLRCEPGRLTIKSFFPLFAECEQQGEGS